VAQGPAVIQQPAVPPAVKPAVPAPAPSYVNADKKSSKVTVLLPAEARLWVDSVECPLTSGVRSFNTPLMNANQKYFYNLKVTVMQDGQPVTETQRVVLTPGQEARVDFNAVLALRTSSR
jgi:uncharacterized protein (TIGR03000 family)